MRSAGESGTHHPTDRTPATAGPAESWALAEAADRRRLHGALAATLTLHLGLLALRLPAFGPATVATPPRHPVTVLTTVRFRPPEPRPAPVREPRRRLVAVPDPTPDAFEPLRAHPIAEPWLDLPADDLVATFPDAPPASAPVEPAPLAVAGEVVAPRRLFAPPPVYTEIARQARRQGLVVVRATVDARGAVADVVLLRGLGLGLDESALAAVRRWSFAPATLRGRPVAVFYDLTVRFELR